MTNRLNELLNPRTTKELIDMWEATRELKTDEGRTVRAWISDELCSRDEAAFIRWAESDGYQSPRAFY